RAHPAGASRRGGRRARARARARATLRATAPPSSTRLRPAAVPASLVLPPPPAPPHPAGHPTAVQICSALYAPGAGKSIRAERAGPGTRRAHPDAQHAEREEQRAEQGEEPPGPQQELVESKLRDRQLVALVALARGREEGGRICRRAGRRRAAQDLLVLHDLGAAGDQVAEPDREQEKPGQDEPAARERMQREGRGRRHGAASSAPSGYWSRRMAERAQRASRGRAPRSVCAMGRAWTTRCSARRSPCRRSRRT